MSEASCHFSLLCPMKMKEFNKYFTFPLRAGHQPSWLSTVQAANVRLSWHVLEQSPDDTERAVLRESLPVLHHNAERRRPGAVAMQRQRRPPARGVQHDRRAANELHVHWVLVRRKQQNLQLSVATELHFVCNIWFGQLLIPISSRGKKFWTMIFFQSVAAVCTREVLNGSLDNSVVGVQWIRRATTSTDQWQTILFHSFFYQALGYQINGLPVSFFPRYFQRFLAGVLTAFFNTGAK